jgi:glutaminyl-tRNA synthetase
LHPFSARAERLPAYRSREIHLLNFGIAQDYQGQCNLRFDDTNPVKEDIEYVESIKNDVQWLGFHWSGDVRYSSDYFDQLHAMR